MKCPIKTPRSIVRSATLGLLCASFSVLGAASLDAQTLGYWRFEGSSSATFLSDSSGNGFNLSLAGNPWGAAPAGTAPTSYPLTDSGAGSKFPKYFEGIGANTSSSKGGGANGSFSGSYFYVADKPAFDFSQGFTVEALINTDLTTGSGRTIAAQGGGAQDGAWFFGLNGNNQLSLMFAKTGGAWGSNALSSQTTGSDYTFVAGHDYYVAVALSIVPNQSYSVVFYIQDLTAGSELWSSGAKGATGSTIQLYNSNLGVTIGGSASNTWSGLIDEVRISQGALQRDGLLINSAIPEASTSALLLGGVTLCGCAVFKMRRRSSAS